MTSRFLRVAAVLRVRAAWKRQQDGGLQPWLRQPSQIGLQTYLIVLRRMYDDV